jgi:hypothetical protein
MKIEISDASASEVVLSRFGGRWHVKARADSPYFVTCHIAKHTRRCLGLPRSNSPWGQKSLLWDGLHDILYGPGSPVEKGNKLNAMFGTTDMIRTRGGNTKTESKPKYKRPKRPSKLHGCHRTNPKCVLYTCFAFDLFNCHPACLEAVSVSAMTRCEYETLDVLS